MADRVPDVRRLLALAALLAAVTAAGFGLAAGFALLLTVQVLHSVCMAPVVPLSDALAVGAMQREGTGFDYARVRSVGSMTFMGGAMAAGFAAGWTGPGVAAGILVVGLLVTAWAALLLPAPPPRSGSARGSLWAPLAEPGFRRILPIAALIQGSHAVYYAFSTLHWQAAGLGTGFIGLLWALGVLAEVALFLHGRRFVERLGLRGLVLLAAGAGVLRWSVTAATSEPAILLLAQLLHGATFGAMHLALIRALVALPAALSGRAQTLAASAIGAATGGLMWLGGSLYAGLGGGAFLAMALLCAIALALGWRLGRVG